MLANRLQPQSRHLVILLCLYFSITASEFVVPAATNNNATSISTSFSHHFLGGSDSKERVSVLKSIQSGKHKQCHYFPIHARDEFFDHSWDKIVGVDHRSNPVYVYNPCMSTYNLGNSLGNYFNELACVLATGISLVIGTKLWIYPTMPIEFKGDKASPHIKRPHGGEHEHKVSLTFFESLPEVLWKKPSSSAPSWSAVESSMKQLCPCEKYCWSHGQAPWIRHHATIREIMNKALDAHMAAKKDSKYARGTIPKLEKPLKTRNDANATTPGVASTSVSISVSSSSSSSSSSSNTVNPVPAQTGITPTDVTTTQSSPLQSHSQQQQANVTTTPVVTTTLTSIDSNSSKSATSTSTPTLGLPIAAAAAGIAASEPLQPTAEQVKAKIAAAILAAGAAGDLSSAEPGSFLPIVPDGVIHYRCGDTVPSNVYGFLTFQTLRDLLPKDAKYIYVLTDPPHRVGIMTANVDVSHKFSHHCRPIMVAMFEYLQRAFPSAVVLVKSGGDPLVDYYRIARARVAICSSSTFCLWPAMASSGRAYFPVTRLLVGWTPEKNASQPLPDLGPSLSWLHHPLMVTEFTADSSLETVLRVLHRTH